jgi:large repetitive protein
MRLLRILLLAAALALLLVPSAAAIRFTDDSFVIPIGTVGEEYFHEFKGDAGCGPELPYQFRLLAGALPPGLTLFDDGLLTGIPTRPGSWSFWVELSDQDPPAEPWCTPKKSQRMFTVDVVTALTITTTTTPPATIGTLYSLPLSAAGGSGARTWSIASGQLPPGLTLNSSTGAITGTPTTDGIYQFRVRVSDGSRQGTRQFTVPVREPLVAQVPRVPPAEVDVPITALKVSATGGFGTKAWRLEGNLPRGLTFDPRTGAITGTPKAPGSFPVKVAVTDSEGRTAAVDLTIVVSPRLMLPATHLKPAQTGRLYQARITVIGGVGGTTFKLLTGRLPAGIHLNPTTGALSGKPRQPGTYQLVIEARDTLGAAAQRVFVLTVR